MIVAQGQAQKDASQAKLYEAQASKAQQDAAIGSAQARAENNRSQIEGVRAAVEAEEVKARIENLRATAIMNLAKAGATQAGSQTDQYLAVLEMLDTLVGWHQGQQQMDMQATAPTTGTVQ